MAVLAWCGFVVGVVVLGVTASSVMKTLLVPRANQSIVTSTVARVNFAAFRLVTNHVDDYTRRDRVWSVGAPTFLAGLLAAWLVSLLLGFALVLWPFTDDSFATALRVAGSSLFTLGFAAPTAPSTTAIAFLAAASGLVVVALQIAYLPALYAAFNRRETLVTMLDAIAGTPPWGRGLAQPGAAQHERRGVVDPPGQEPEDRVSAHGGPGPFVFAQRGPVGGGA